MTRRIELDSPDPALEVGPQELLAHCREMFASLARSDQRRASEAYVRGLLHCPGKKSIRRIAMESAGGPSEQSLQQFVNQSGWDPDPVRRRLADRTCAVAPPLAWVVDEAAFPKHGRQSAGVDRQYVRAQGRSSNCQIGVFAALASAAGTVPVSWRLALPRSWDTDELRRRKAHIPSDQRHQPSWRYAVDVLDDLCGDWGVPVAPVLLDLRQSTALTDTVGALDDRGLEFLLRVDGSTPVRFSTQGPRPTRIPDPRRPPVDGTLEDLSGPLSGLPRRTLSWLEPGTGREMRAHFSSAQVRSVVPAAAPQVLLLEWGLGKPTPRAFWLSSMIDRDLDELVALTRLADRAGAEIDVLADRFGLCDFEGRSFLGWHHHVTLVSVAYAFSLLTEIGSTYLTESGSGRLKMSPK